MIALKPLPAIFATTLLVAGLLPSCGGDSGQQASAAETAVAFTDPVSATDAAIEALNSKDYATAVAGFRYAMDELEQPELKFNSAEQLFKALAENNQIADAKALLEQVTQEFPTMVDGMALRRWTGFCLDRSHTQLAQVLLDQAIDTLDEEQLAIYEPERAGESLKFARSGDKDSMAALGYVGDEAETPVRKLPKKDQLSDTKN